MGDYFYQMTDYGSIIRDLLGLLRVKFVKNGFAGGPQNRRQVCRRSVHSIRTSDCHLRSQI